MAWWFLCAPVGANRAVVAAGELAPATILDRFVGGGTLAGGGFGSGSPTGPVESSARTAASCRRRYLGGVVY
jgi:hypothetical protein